MRFNAKVEVAPCRGRLEGNDNCTVNLRGPTTKTLYLPPMQLDPIVLYMIGANAIDLTLLHLEFELPTMPMRDYRSIHESWCYSGVFGLAVSAFQRYFPCSVFSLDGKLFSNVQSGEVFIILHTVKKIRSTLHRSVKLFVPV